MLVSVSDDNTIRVWGPEQVHRRNHPETTSDCEDEDDIAAPSSAAANGHLPHSLMSSLDISEH